MFCWFFTTTNLLADTIDYTIVVLFIVIIIIYLFIFLGSGWERVTNIIYGNR